MRELIRRIHMERVDHAVVVPELELGQRVRRIPVGRADHDPARRIDRPDRLQRTVGERIPFLGVHIAHFVQQLEGEAGLVVITALKREPQRNEAVLKPRIVEKRHLLLDVAVVPNRLVKIEHDVEPVLLAPAHEVVNLPERPLAVPAGRLFQNDLVKAKTDVIEAP